MAYALMRHKPKVSNVLMDFLFAELALHAQAEGYRWFNLGAAPLAGLSDHPQHALARAQMHGFGAMLSFAVDERRVNPDAVLHRLRLIVPAVSLGGVETIICAPARTSHSGLTPDERAHMGVTDGLLRLSVGIEHVDDLIADLDQALNGVVHPAGEAAS